MRNRWMGAVIPMGLLVAGLALAAPAAAQDGSAADTNSPTEKLGRGLRNGILGWTEIVARPGEAAAQEKRASGAVTGLVDGVALGTVRTVTGAAEVATFWSPLPVKYQPPIQEPASPWDRR